VRDQSLLPIAHFKVAIASHLFFFFFYRPGIACSLLSAIVIVRIVCRTRASKRFGLKDEDLVASPLRRLTKYNMHAAIVRWFIMDEVASFAKSLTRAQPTAAKAKPPPPLTDLILIDDDDDDHGHVGSDVGDEEDGAEEIVPVPEDHDDDNDFQETIVAKKKKKEKEEKKKARKLLMEEE
jgi:hypothetical protein